MIHIHISYRWLQAKVWSWNVCRYLQTDPGFMGDGLSRPRSTAALARLDCIWPAWPLRNTVRTYCLPVWFPCFWLKEMLHCLKIGMVHMHSLDSCFNSLVFTQRGVALSGNRHGTHVLSRFLSYSAMLTSIDTTIHHMGNSSSYLRKTIRCINVFGSSGYSGWICH